MGTLQQRLLGTAPLCDRWLAARHALIVEATPPQLTTSAGVLALGAVQGLAGDKAKLEFVRSYYEFLPKSLYTDTR